MGRAGSRKLAVLAAGLALMAGPAASPRAHALETDQFTVPAAPLPDIGTELAVEVMRRIDVAVGRVNARAAGHARAAAKAPAGGFWRRHHLRAVDAALSEGRLAREVYAELAGPGLPECHIERWVRKHRFATAGGAACFEVSTGRSAYGASPFARSPFIMSLSPTVRTFGVYCGADKIGHVFQQGYEYFDDYTRAEARAQTAGEVVAAARAAAVRRGVDQERGLYGLALVGVYSNADLAANYAGLKLYLNLTRPVRIGNVTRPPLLVLRDGQWVHNAGADARVASDVGPTARRAELFLRPFVSEHFNEALNPSRYAQPTRGTVRARWRGRAAAWVAFYRTTRDAEQARLHDLSTWHGEPYGHSGLAGLVTAADTCFPAPALARAAAATPGAARAPRVPVMSAAPAPAASAAGSRVPQGDQPPRRASR